MPGFFRFVADNIPVEPICTLYLPSGSIIFILCVITEGMPVLSVLTNKPQFCFISSNLTANPIISPVILLQDLYSIHDLIWSFSKTAFQLVTWKKSSIFGVWP